MPSTPARPCSRPLCARSREEAGPDLRVRPLGVVHASTFAYDALVTRMISVTFVMAHEGGEVVPGDDMAGSRSRWASLGDIGRERLRLVPPLDQQWLRQRTIDLYRLWQPAPDVPLQSPLVGRRLEQERRRRLTASSARAGGIGGRLELGLAASPPRRRAAARS